jgi:hypothetical protein
VLQEKVRPGYQHRYETVVAWQESALPTSHSWINEKEKEEEAKIWKILGWTMTFTIPSID